MARRKVQTTLWLTPTQVTSLRETSKRTGYPQSSIIRIGINWAVANIDSIKDLILEDLALTSDNLRQQNPTSPDRITEDTDE